MTENPPEIIRHKAKPHAEQHRKQRGGQGDLLENFAGHRVKNDRSLPASRCRISLAVCAFERRIDAVGRGFQLLFQIMECSPRLRDILAPFAFESFEFGVG